MAQTPPAQADAGADGADGPLPGPFISYSRRDRSFAQRLVDALRARNRDAWVDLEGIEPSEEWLKKLHAAIDAAQAFVFVISPDAIRSRHCEDEIRYAAEGNKKLIPILWRDVAAEQLPEALARIQWISFVDDAHFESSVDELVRALDTDLAWNARHTRLLVRAREWSLARDRSLLLRGNDLKEAEQWLLDSAAAHDRQPAVLQTEYIGASAAAEKRFRNRLLGSVSGAAVLALTLAAVALYQRNVAQENERQAVSRQLAAQAQAEMARDPGLSMLLAAAAYQRRPTFEATQALRAAARHSPHLEAFLHGHDARVHKLVFGAHGALLASSAQNGRIIVWDVNTLQTVYDTIVNAPGRSPAVALHPTRGLLASAGEGGVVHLRAVDGNAVADTLRPAAPAVILTFSTDGTLLASGGQDGSVTVWSVEPLAERCRSLANAAPATALRFDASGARVAVLTENGAFRVLAAGHCTVTASSGGDFYAPTAAIGAALETAVALADGFPDITVLDPSTGRATVHENSTGTTDFLLGTTILGADTLALAAAGGSVLLWSADRKRTVGTLRGHRSDATAVGYDPERRRLASGSILGEVIVWDLDRPLPLEPVRVIPTRAVDLAFTRDGQQLLAIEEDGATQLWDVASLQPLAELAALPRERNTAINANAERVATLSSGLISVRRWRDSTLLDSVRLESYEPTQLAFGPEGDVLAFVDRGRVHLRNLAEHSSRDVAAAAPGTGAVGFSASGDALLYVAPGDTVVSYAVGAGSRALFSPPGQAGPVQSIARSGNLLATGAHINDGNVLLWDAPARRILRTLPSGTQLPIARVLFSPDATLLAAVVQFSEMVQVWDVASGQLFLGPVQLAGRAEQSLGVAFSPDGRLLATAERQGVVLRDLDPDRWVQAICRSANRSLTEEEWRAYAGEYAFEGICPDLSAAARSDPARPATRRR